MRLRGEFAQVSDPVVRARGAEYGAEGRAGRHRGQGRPAARRPAPDRQPASVRLALLGESKRGGDHVLHVDHAPLPAQPVPVQAAVPGRAAIVHINDPDAAAGEVRLSQVEEADCMRGGTAVHPDHIGRQFALGCYRRRVSGRVHERVHAAAELAVQQYLTRYRQVGPVGMSSVSRRSTVVSPVAASIRMTDSGVVGPPATPTIVLPSADRPEVNSWKPMSGSVISAVSGSSSPRCMLPTPCRTASLPSPSTANGRPPSCHSGSANSSSAGNSAWAGSPTRPTWYTFHQPGQSDTT